MKKVWLTLAALGLALCLVCVSASAAHAAKLTVFGEQRGDGNEKRNSFVFHEKLLNRKGEHIGRNRIEFFRVAPGEFRVRAKFRFEGGKIRVAGPLENNTDTVPISRGRGRYHGIEGRLRVGEGPGDLTRYTFNYSRPR